MPKTSRRNFRTTRDARRNSLQHLFATASIELSQLGPEAVTFGAATLPMEDFLSRPPLPESAGGELRPAVPGEHFLEVRRRT